MNKKKYSNDRPRADVDGFDSGPVISRCTRGVLHRQDFNENNDTPARIRRRLVNAHQTHIFVIAGARVYYFNYRVNIDSRPILHIYTRV